MVSSIITCITIVLIESVHDPIVNILEQIQFIQLYLCHIICCSPTYHAGRLFILH